MQRIKMQKAFTLTFFVCALCDIDFWGVWCVGLSLIWRISWYRDLTIICPRKPASSKCSNSLMLWTRATSTLESSAKCLRRRECTTLTKSFNHSLITMMLINQALLTIENSLSNSLESTKSLSSNQTDHNLTVIGKEIQIVINFFCRISQLINSFR